MKNILLLLAAATILFFSCTKGDNANNGIVLRSSVNPYQDSLTINTSTYTILYLGGIYTYAPTGSPTASIQNFNITTGGSNVCSATLTRNTYTSLQMNTPNAVFQSNLYVGK